MEQKNTIPVRRVVDLVGITRVSAFYDFGPHVGVGGCIEGHDDTHISGGSVSNEVRLKRLNQEDELVVAVSVYGDHVGVDIAITNQFGPGRTRVAGLAIR